MKTLCNFFGPRRPVRPEKKGVVRVKPSAVCVAWGELAEGWARVRERARERERGRVVAGRGQSTPEKDERR